MGMTLDLVYGLNLVTMYQLAMDTMHEEPAYSRVLTADSSY